MSNSRSHGLHRILNPMRSLEFLLTYYAYDFGCRDLGFQSAADGLRGGWPMSKLEAPLGKEV